MCAEKENHVIFHFFMFVRFYWGTKQDIKTKKKRMIKMLWIIRKYFINFTTLNILYMNLDKKECRFYFILCNVFLILFIKHSINFHRFVSVLVGNVCVYRESTNWNESEYIIKKYKNNSINVQLTIYTTRNQNERT